MAFRSIKGTYDILPNDADSWQGVETCVREFITRAGYSEIRTPAFEKTELFTRSVGEDSELYQKKCTAGQTKAEQALLLNQNIQLLLYGLIFNTILAQNLP